MLLPNKLLAIYIADQERKSRSVFACCWRCSATRFHFCFCRLIISLAAFFRLFHLSFDVISAMESSRGTNNNWNKTPTISRRSRDSSLSALERTASFESHPERHLGICWHSQKRPPSSALFSFLQSWFVFLDVALSWLAFVTFCSSSSSSNQVVIKILLEFSLLASLQNK